jgi:murein DD-endopeptidase MepM/ murein hydrolase activator NlpD
VKAKGDFIVTVFRIGETHGRSFFLSTKSLATSIVVALVCLTGLIFTGVHHYRVWLTSVEFEQLEKELDRSREEYDGIKVAAKQLTDQIAALQVTAQRLKIRSGFDEDALGGVGGPSKATNPVLSLNQKDISKHFRSLDQKRITLETELRQLQDYYTTNEILMAATPSVMPVRGYPSDRFGRRADPFNGQRDFHPGIDISAPRGAKVIAAADGVVVFAGYRKDYGRLVAIEHKFGISTRYGHLDRYTVKPGDEVTKGDIIGYVGTTGRSTGPHVHYEVRLRNQPLNPLRFIGSPP